MGWLYTFHFSLESLQAVMTLVLSVSVFICPCVCVAGDPGWSFDSWFITADWNSPWSISSVSHVSLLNLFKCAFLDPRAYVCVRGRPHRMRCVCLCFVHRLFGHAGLTRSCRACSCVYGNCFVSIHIYARHVSFLRARVSVLASWEKRPKGDGLFVL